MAFKFMAQKNGFKPRQSIRYPVEGYVKTFSKFSNETMKLKNISSDGLCCITKRMFEPGGELMIVLPGPLFGEVIQRTIRVAWCKRGHNSLNELGAQFLNENVDMNEISRLRTRGEFISHLTAPDITKTLSVEAGTMEKSAEKKTIKVSNAKKILILAGLSFVIIALGMFFATERSGNFNKWLFLPGTLHLSGIYYESNGARFAIINGLIVKEGDFITKNIKIEKILKNSVLLSGRNRTMVLKENF